MKALKWAVFVGLWLAACVAQDDAGDKGDEVRTQNGEACEHDYRVAECAGADAGCYDEPRSAKPIQFVDGVCRYGAERTVCFSYNHASNTGVSSYYATGETDVWELTGAKGLRSCDETGNPPPDEPAACGCAFGVEPWGDAGTSE